MKEILIRHIRNLEDFESLRENWPYLQTQCAEKTAFLSWEWLYAWWKHHAEGRELWLLTAWHESNLVGVAPLMLSKTGKHGIPFRLLQTLGTPNTDQSNFMAANEELEIIIQLCEYIMSQRDKWDAIELNEYADEDPSTREICNIFSKHGLVLDIKSNLHYHIPITESWDDYFKSLPKHTRHELTRKQRHIKEKHTLDLKCFRGAEVKWEHFETFFEINKRGSYPDKYETKSERAFQREIFELTRTCDWVEIMLLYLDDKPVAFEYGFNTGGRFEYWRTGYDKEYGGESVGNVLLVLLMKELFEKGYCDCDFLRGAHEYKNRWNPRNRKFINLIAIKPYHLPSRFALINLPQIWLWAKTNILRKRGNHNQ